MTQLNSTRVNNFKMKATADDEEGGRKKSVLSDNGSNRLFFVLVFFFAFTATLLFRQQQRLSVLEANMVTAKSTADLTATPSMHDSFVPNGGHGNAMLSVSSSSSSRSGFDAAAASRPAFDTIMFMNFLIRNKKEAVEGAKEPWFDVMRKNVFGLCAEKKLKLGQHDYAICNIDVTSSTVVYSIGIGDDFSWDQAMINRFACNIYAYDPTPIAISFVDRNKGSIDMQRFKFHEIGVFTKDDDQHVFYLPANPQHVSGTTKNVDLYNIITGSNNAPRQIHVKMRTLETLMKNNGHRYIDILKMDIEDAEFDILTQLLNTYNDLPTDFFMIETGERYDDPKDDAYLLPWQRNGPGTTRYKELFQRIAAIGFAIYDVGGSQNSEFSFIRHPPRKFMLPHQV